jgi:hypothetical protein
MSASRIITPLQLRVQKRACQLVDDHNHYLSRCENAASHATAAPLIGSGAAFIAQMPFDETSAVAIMTSVFGISLVYSGYNVFKFDALSKARSQHFLPTTRDEFITLAHPTYVDTAALIPADFDPSAANVEQEARALIAAVNPLVLL